MRLFVAAYPPPDFAEQLVAATAKLADQPGWPRQRTLTPDTVHLTLQFVGETDPRQVDVVAESVAHACAGLRAVATAVERLIVLPEHGPARLIAAECASPRGLTELHARLARRLARNPRSRSAEGFLPHMTLARFVAPAQTEMVRNGMPTLPASVSTPFTIAEVRLMRSVLKPHGAVHTPIARVTFQSE